MAEKICLDRRRRERQEQEEEEQEEEEEEQEEEEEGGGCRRDQCDLDKASVRTDDGHVCSSLFTRERE